jgi:hypothetical protein
MKYTIDINYEFCDELMRKTLKADFLMVKQNIKNLKRIKNRADYQNEDLRYDQKLIKGIKAVLKYYSTSEDYETFMNKKKKESNKMMNRYELKQTLQKGVATVTFTKKDGSLREMKCTLNSEYLPPQLLQEGDVSDRKENEDVLAVWDIDSNGWRSFRMDSIISIQT